MQTNGLGAPMPRSVNPRQRYGVDTSAPAGAPAGAPESAPAVRSTFPTRAQPAPIERPTAPVDQTESLRPPKGTDPELWKVLTADERAFFAREEAMGPLSYGHHIASGPTIPARGGRLNLRG